MWNEGRSTLKGTGSIQSYAPAWMRDALDTGGPFVAVSGPNPKHLWAFRPLSQATLDEGSYGLGTLRLGC